jgi:chromosomal replication initiator protein
LEGAVNKIAGMAHVYQRPVDIGLAQEALRDLLPKKSVRISIDDILRHVSEHFGVQMRDLVSRRRPKSIAYPRQICMYLARKLTSHSLEEIGGYFGGRDHTTVMYAYDKIRKEVEERPETAQTIEVLTSELTR